MIVLIFAIFVAEITFDYVDDDVYIASTSVFMIFSQALLMMYISYKERIESSEKVRNMERIIDVEKIYYEQLEARMEEMAKIRHDYNNVLSSVKFLINEGRTQEACSVIDDLNVRLNATKGYVFSGIPIIDAVISEKKRILDDMGVDTDVDIIVPESLDAKDLDLCMIFTNLIDNAIRACDEVINNGEKAKVSLSGRKVGGYIVFKCVNTALPNPDKTIKGTGYGQKILCDIANRYNGEFHAEFNDGSYTACISIVI